MKQKPFSRTGRAIALLLTAVLCLMVVIQPSNPAALAAVDSVRTVNNIVLFAQFRQEDGYNFMDAARTELLTDGLNRKDTVNSLYGYMDAISYGQIQTACYVPQLDGDTIQPYVLTQTLESYTRESLALEIIRNVSIPENIPLDGDNDGYLDNVILVIDGAAETQQDTLWPHEASLAYAGVTINGKTVDTYNLHNSERLFGSAAHPFQTSVVFHEFLHSLGYPDLYRSGSGTPVGTMWDIMAGSVSDYPVAPLAYMRASRSGWLETADITEDGTYTLAPASADSGNRVYLLKTPLSDTEFFAVEFRKQGESWSDLDGICNTGMLVYRVNTAVDGNRHSGEQTQDEIYIFRPENADLTGQANYGGEGRADSIGSLHPEDGIAEGALTYSNGTNSGIRIDNITIDGDRLTFEVQFAEIDQQAQWQSVPNNIEADLPGTLDMAVSESGAVYLAVGKRNSTAVGLYRISGTECEQISDVTAGSMYEVQLAIAGETLYLLYHDAEYRAVVCSYDAGTGTWQTLWQSKMLAQYTDIAAGGNAVYIAYTEGEFPSGRLHVIRYADGTVTELGGVISEAAFPVSLVCTSETVAAAYRDYADRLPKLAVWEGENWTTITLSDRTCSGVQAVSDGETITAAVTGEGAGLYHVQGGTVTFTDYPELPGEAVDVLPLYVNGTLLTGIFTQLDYDYAVYGYDGGWNKYGSSIETQYINAPCAVVSGNTIYTAYQTGSSVLIRMLQYGGTAQTLPGDVNADGSFDILDVICLQKWLLCADQKLSDGTAGDFDKNGILDVFDLALMKRALLRQLL